MNTVNDSGSEKHKSKRHYWLILLIIILACLFVALLPLYNKYINPRQDWTPVPFDQQTWLTASEHQRGCMVSDLVAPHSPPESVFSSDELLTPENRLYGLTKDQVLELLGEPDRKRDNYFSYKLGYVRRNPNAIEYQVFGVGRYWLSVDFDDNNIVTLVKIQMGS